MTTTAEGNRGTKSARGTVRRWLGTAPGLTTVVLGGLLLSFGAYVVPTIFVVGYLVRVLREGGSDSLPLPSTTDCVEDWRRFLVDGIGGLGLWAVCFLPAILVVVLWSNAFQYLGGSELVRAGVVGLLGLLVGGRISYFVFLGLRGTIETVVPWLVPHLGNPNPAILTAPSDLLFVWLGYLTPDPRRASQYLLVVFVVVFLAASYLFPAILARFARRDPDDASVVGVLTNSAYIRRWPAFLTLVLLGWLPGILWFVWLIVARFDIASLGGAGASFVFALVVPATTSLSGTVTGLVGLAGSVVSFVFLVVAYAYLGRTIELVQE